MESSCFYSLFQITPEMLPEIRSSSEIYGKVCDGSALDGLPITGVRLNVINLFFINHLNSN